MTRGRRPRFRIDPVERRLWRDGAPLRVRRKVFDLLTLFVANEGRLLSREEILAEVWAGRHLSDAVLKGCMRDLRRALDDDAARPRHVEAVPGHGYRFLGGVDAVGAPSPGRGPPAWDETLPSVAVVPIEALAGAAPIAGLVAEELRAELAQHARLRLVPCGEAIGRGDRLRLRAAARRIGARHLVLGSSWPLGPEVRLHLDLVDAEAGRSLWRGRVVISARGDQAHIEREARAAAGAISARLRAADWARVLVVPPGALTAHDHLLLAEGRPAVDAAANALAQRDYERAIALAPDCAPAWAGLAHGYALDGVFDFDHDYEGSMGRALAAAAEARRLGPTCGKAAWVMGHVLSLMGEPDSALHVFAWAERLAPRDADLQVMYGSALGLAGRAEASEARHRWAAALDPDQPGWHARHAGLAAYHRGAYEEAVARLAPVVARRPTASRQRVPLAAALARLGRGEEAAQVIAPVLASIRPPSLERERAHVAWRYRGGAKLIDHWLEGLALAGLPERPADPGPTLG